MQINLFVNGSSQLNLFIFLINFSHNQTQNLYSIKMTSTDAEKSIELHVIRRNIDTEPVSPSPSESQDNNQSRKIVQPISFDENEKLKCQVLTVVIALLVMVFCSLVFFVDFEGYIHNLILYNLKFQRF
jgi:hypothetical protein